jgi:glutathione S-transferase
MSEALRRCYVELEETLASGAYLCGDLFTVAGIATFLVVGFASTFGTGLGDRQRSLRGWLERVQAQPTVGREIEAMMRATATV